MIDHVWTIVCSRSVIDKESNNISIQNVIEQVTIREEPKPEGRLPLPLHIVTLWARADFDVPAQGHGRLTFLSPSGEVNDGPFEYPIDLLQHKRSRSRGNLQVLHVGESGRHVFRVELRNEDDTEWHQVAAIPLEISFVPPEETE